jgi:hypothetical protein
MSSTVCYLVSFTFYVDDVCTSQKTHQWASTACYEDSFTFLLLQELEILKQMDRTVHVSVMPSALSRCVLPRQELHIIGGLSSRTKKHSYFCRPHYEECLDASARLLGNLFFVQPNM